MQLKDKIRVNHVSKVFKMYNTPMDKMKEALSVSGKVLHTDFYAVTDLSFSVEQGEILGIMGRNGSGKSTLLKMITGIYEPSEGTIEITGKISSLLELGTGFHMEYTGIENIYFYGTLMGFTRKQMEEKLGSIIDFAEIGDYVYQPVKTYSSGMFARLAFSCAINVEPDILIVDEILSVGDMRFQAKCFRKFKEFQDRGVTILYVGHDVGMMRTFCDRVMWINKGRLVDIGDPTFISAKYTEFMYLDDITAFTDYKLLGSGTKADREAGEKMEKSVQEPQKQERKVSNSLFPDSIAHWGIRPGLIQYVKICDISNQEQNIFSTQEDMRIVIGFDVDNDIRANDFSVAFSIKNTEGTDLIVKTTYEEGIEILNGKCQEIMFEFKPRLASDDYYLVVALENRENAAISYYEYIEGVSYFKMYTNKKIFGVVDVETNILYNGTRIEKGALCQKM
ncbi:MAG: ABC transporter ATP-binding protein [Lachnospiraceae bacterium]|nr:ABC transporter ATP-binding protein [Lachnospiraceae bacterium]